MAQSKMLPTKPDKFNHFWLSESRRSDLRNFYFNFKMEAELNNGEYDLVFKSSRLESIAKRKETEKAQAVFMEWWYSICKEHGFPHRHKVGVGNRRGWELFTNRKIVDALSIPDIAIYLKWYGASEEYVISSFGNRDRMVAAMYQGLLIHGITKEELEHKIKNQSFTDFLRHELTKETTLETLSPELETTENIPCKNENCTTCFRDGIFIGDFLYAAMHV